MPNIFVLRVRNGFIVESRDYQGPFRAPDRKPIGGFWRSSQQQWSDLLDRLLEL